MFQHPDLAYSVTATRRRDRLTEAANYRLAVEARAARGAHASGAAALLRIVGTALVQAGELLRSAGRTGAAPRLAGDAGFGD